MADLNSPRRAVFAGYLGSAVALTVPWEINFNLLQVSNYYLSLCTGRCRSEVVFRWFLKHRRLGYSGGTWDLVSTNFIVNP